MARSRPAPTPATQITEGIRAFRVDSLVATGVVDADDNAVQWVYQVTEMYKAGPAYGQWTARADADGYSGDAYNYIEDGNDGTGVQQNGIDHDGADYDPIDFDMSPLLVGATYPGHLIRCSNGSGGTIREAWMWMGNAEDGTC
jgi:hypothetical protein